MLKPKVLPGLAEGARQTCFATWFSSCPSYVGAGDNVSGSSRG